MTLGLRHGISCGKLKWRCCGVRSMKEVRCFAQALQAGASTGAATNEEDDSSEAKRLRQLHATQQTMQRASSYCSFGRACEREVVMNILTCDTDGLTAEGVSLASSSVSGWPEVFRFHTVRAVAWSRCGVG
jgi:hypothetical protein